MSFAKESRLAIMLIFYFMFILKFCLKIILVARHEVSLLNKSYPRVIMSDMIKSSLKFRNNTRRITLLLHGFTAKSWRSHLPRVSASGWFV
jgi:hypothetical protein